MSRNEYFAYGSNLNFEQMAYRCPEGNGGRHCQAGWL